VEEKEIEGFCIFLKNSTNSKSFFFFFPFSIFNINFLDWISYAIIDSVTDSFMPIIRDVELEVDSIDDLVLILKESEQTDMLKRIGSARKKVTSLSRLIISKADVLRTIIKRQDDGIAPDSETCLYLEDISGLSITFIFIFDFYNINLFCSLCLYFFFLVFLFK